MAQKDIVTEELVLQSKSSNGVVPTEEAIQSQLLPSPGSFKTLKEARAEFEKAYLIRLLQMCDGKATRAAEIAGKYRADFYDLLKKHEIRVADFKKTA
jgi:two-component system response regulator GlrR